ncbi:exonuclease V [Mycena epipterygia]|nr:exonuclease V [Mycena epipterygia]
MSEDSYEAYNDFADLTEEDFARLDADVSQIITATSPGLPNLPQTSQNHAGIAPAALPSISIEVEGSHTPEKPTYPSPIHRYRRWGTLSVTDLISPAWCELQFDYGLRQKRSRRLRDRPASFRGDSGKEIVVQQDVAARNDQTTKRGKFIHKELELELRPEEIQIVLTNEEERWALRLINFLSSLVSLIAEGCVREIPVFGVVNDVVVVGIIDELATIPAVPEIGTKRASDSSLPSPKRVCRTPSPSCEAELISAALAPTPPPQYLLRMIDTKTRRTDSLPSDEDAEPARLQLMLYHRLLTGLLETYTPFDYSALWASLNLNPSAPFSPEFLQQTASILGRDSVPHCLDDTAILLRTGLVELDLPRLDRTLQIIYRSQNKYSDRRRNNKGKGRETDSPSEEDEMAKAIAMSLADVFDTELANALIASALESVVDGPLVVFNSGSNFNLETVQGPSTSGLNNGQLEHASGERATSHVEDATRPDILGTKEFLLDEEFLESYLTSTLEWWQGTRTAKGVSERQTGRCFSCEYRDDCEWREQKASEKLSEVKRRRELLNQAAF